MNNVKPNRHFLLAAIALCTAIFAILWFIVAALGVKYGIWSIGVGLIKMSIQWGPYVLGLAALVSALAFATALLKSPRKGALLLAGTALVISAVSILQFRASRSLSDAMPPIHDVQTDWSNPIRPSEKLLATRAADGETNPIEDAPIVPETASRRWPGTGGKLFSELQESAERSSSLTGAQSDRAYPPINSLNVGNVSLTDTFDAIRASFAKMDIETVNDDVANGLIEGTATTGWYGFKDDVMVRATSNPDDGSTIVDVRSTSRIGFSDLGANAVRVSAFLDILEANIQSSK